MNTIKVAILGLGTVGTGVYKLIQKRADVMERTAGAKLEVKKILVRNMQKKREGVEQELLTDNWKEILEDDEISVVIEVMGGLEPAKTMILEALEAGKNVVSANKDLIAEEGHVLLDTAQKNQVDFLFEAAVAGGIPIIRPLKQCLAANDISEIVGIVIQTRLLISPPSRNVIPLVASTNRLNTRAIMTPMIAITLNSAFKNVPAPLRMIPAISTISSFPSFSFFTLLKLKRTKTRATTTTANTAYQITELSISSTPIKYIFANYRLIR